MASRKGAIYVPGPCFGAIAYDIIHSDERHLPEQNAIFSRPNPRRMGRNLEGKLSAELLVGYVGLCLRLSVHLPGVYLRLINCPGGELYSLLDRPGTLLHLG
jgi:hypothetical protein